MDPKKQKIVASKGGQHSHGGKQQPSDAAPNTASETEPKLRKSEDVKVKRGDLVRYHVGANMTEGNVLTVATEPFTDNTGANHKASLENPIAKIENQYTKHVSYHHLSALEFLARKDDYPGYIKDQEEAPKEATSKSGKKAKGKYLKEKLAPQIEVKVNPENFKFEKGDIVRYKAGQNYTAGVIMDVFWHDLHDENGRFHSATSDAPMAKIENLWSKHANYHHLNVLELVRKASSLDLDKLQSVTHLHLEETIVRIPVKGETVRTSTKPRH